MQETNKIWAKAQKFSAYFAEVLSRFPKPTDSRMKRPTARERRAAPLMANLAEAVTKTSVAMREYQRSEIAVEACRDELVAGTVTVLGRQFDKFGNAEVVVVPPGFWIGANIDPHKDSAWSTAAKFDKLRVVASIDRARAAGDKHSLTAVPHIVAGPSEGSPHRTGGPKSKGAIILDAIAACARGHKAWWNRPPRDRIQGYKDWLRTNHPEEDLAARGFSAKTFEKFERQYGSSSRE